MNEDALARLEAGLRAQREMLRRAPPQASPSLSPVDNDCDQQRDPIDIPNFLKKDMKQALA